MLLADHNYVDVEKLCVLEFVVPVFSLSNSIP